MQSRAVLESAPPTWSVDCWIDGERSLRGERQLKESLHDRHPAPFESPNRYLELIVPLDETGASDSMREVLTVLDVSDLTDDLDAMARLLVEDREDRRVTNMAIEHDFLKDAEVVDYWLFTTMNVRRRRRGCPKSVRSCRVIASQEVFICVWTDYPEARWGDEFDFEHDLRVTGPIPERTVRHGYVVDVVGSGGLNESARLVQDLMRHNEWGIGQVLDRIATWQRCYFREVVENGLSASNGEIDGLGRDLAAISSALGEARECVRDLGLRVEHHQVIGEDECLPELLVECEDRVEAMLRDVDHGIAETRECFGLLAGGFASQQVDQQHNFQVAVSAIASLVLIPGLILSLYGANVQGLPGAETRLGLVVIGAASLIGSVATAILIRFLNRRSWLKSAITVAGAAVLLGLVILAAESENVAQAVN